MPSGYTAAIKPDSDYPFERFAMDCARAFGACIMLRDDPGGGEAIPERFEPSDYHEKALAKAKDELARLTAMSTEDVLAECEREHAIEVGRVRQRNMESEDQRRAYEKMLAQVRAWRPPSAEHHGLKNFMVEQITSSIDFDCRPLSEPVRATSPAEWHQERIKRTYKDIGYHAAEHAKEVACAEQRTAWVQMLRQSLVPSKVSP